MKLYIKSRIYKNKVKKHEIYEYIFKNLNLNLNLYKKI